MRRIGSQIKADNYNFDIVKECIYLGSAITTKNEVSLENKRRITLVNRCYYGLHGQLSSREISLSYSKTNALQDSYHPRASLWGRGLDSIKQSLYKEKSYVTFGAVLVGDEFRIRSNSELYEHLNDIDAFNTARPCRSIGEEYSGETGI